MLPRTITHNSDEFVQGDGTLYITPLGYIETPEGSSIYKYGNPLKLIFKLYNNAGVQIPANSNIFVAKKQPGADFPVFIDKISYQQFYDLSIAQLTSAEYAHVIRHEIAYDEVVNPQRHRLEFYVESSAAVDLARAETRVVIEAIETN